METASYGLSNLKRGLESYAGPISKRVQVHSHVTSTRRTSESDSESRSQINLHSFPLTTTMQCPLLAIVTAVHPLTPPASRIKHMVDLGLISFPIHPTHVVNQTSSLNRSSCVHGLEVIQMMMKMMWK
jgi:hypothetical protein